MFYVSFGGEVDTKRMIKAAQKSGKIVAVPVCKKNRVTIRPCILEDKTELVKGTYGICEPARKKFVNLKDIDLVLVPGLAFDKQGNRLGRGKGCYDYFLKRLPKDTPTIGLAFDFQILSCLPATISDVKVQRLIFA
jgi:5-formyltetrahydrofolate cyclo-ligase